MGLYISPNHVVLGPQSFDLDDLIEIFLARIDGWHLEVADRCINGWAIDGKQAITTVHLDGTPANYIPDSGFAVLQVVFNYFETIAAFKAGVRPKRGQSGDFFKEGVRDVFPELDGTDAASILWKLRGGLYHIGASGDMVILRHTLDTKPIGFNSSGVLVIDPQKLIPALRQHFQCYAESLRDSNQVKVRKNFQKAFKKIYGDW